MKESEMQELHGAGYVVRRVNHASQRIQKRKRKNKQKFHCPCDAHPQLLGCYRCNICVMFQLLFSYF